MSRSSPSPRFQAQSPHVHPHPSPHSGLHHGMSPLVRSLTHHMWHALEKSARHLPCSHLHSGIDESACRSTICKPDSWQCEQCETSNAIRMCLSCGSCACERHSYSHYEHAPTHTLFLQLNAEDKPVFCYADRLIVRDDNDQQNIAHIRDILEDVQTLNVEVLCKTTRSGRKRVDGASTNALAAAAAEKGAAARNNRTTTTTTSSGAASAPDESAGDSTKMSDVDADSDALPPEQDPAMLSRRESWMRVKSWHKAVPFLSQKAQMARRKEDQLRTCLFRWRNRALVQCFQSWKFAMRTGRPARQQRKKQQAQAQTPGGLVRTTRSRVGHGAAGSIAELDLDGDVPMLDLDLTRIQEEGRPDQGASDDVVLPTGAKAVKRGRGRPPKRARSEERHDAAKEMSGPKAKPTADDDLLSPKMTRGSAARGCASARVSPHPSRSSSPKPVLDIAKATAAIKLSSGCMGLRNLGNTCYLNSVLQALSLTSAFRHYYVECIPKLLPPLRHSDKHLLNARAAKNKRAPRVTSDADSDSSDDEDEEDYSSLSRDFAELLATIWKGQRIMFTPDHFLQTVWTLYERFKGFKQQDAQEFVLFLMNQLSKEQEVQVPKQKLERKFQNPALGWAKDSVHQPAPPSDQTASATTPAPTAASGKKRKERNQHADSESTTDGDTVPASEEPPANRRRSARSSTVISTTSSNSVAAQEAHAHADAASPCAAPTSASSPSLSSSAAYATPLPPSSLASVEVRPPGGARVFSVPRLVVSRPNDFIVQNFAGVVRSEIKCSACHRVSASESDFLGMISVQIPPKGFLLAGEEDHHPADAEERHASMHHSTSASQLAGGSSASAPASTFLSVSRSLHQSRSEQSLGGSGVPPPSPSLTGESGASISQRNRVRHDKLSGVTLQQCLAFTFTQPEVLDGANAYQCGGCRQKVRAEKSQVLQAVPPEYLILHIGRTVYDATTYATKKDQTHVAFPLTDLDLAPFLPKTADAHHYRYSLYALVNHHGRGLNEGHFTAVGKSPDHDCWLLFNDARVNVIPVERVLESQAYLLFYRRNPTDPA